MNTTLVSFGLAPNNVLPFLFSFPYIANWVSFGFVFAEKLRKIVEIRFYFCLKRYGTVNEVLPTPDYPVNKTGFYSANKILKTYEYFKVLMVGTSS